MRGGWESIGLNRVVLALSLARMADALGNSLLFIILPLDVARLAAPDFPFPESIRVGILISAYGLVNAVCQPLLGALSDRLGKRKILIQTGLVLMGASTLAFIAATRYLDLLLLRALQGVGVALSIPASLAIMAGVTDKKTRGGSMGVYTTMRMAGFAIGPLVGGFLQPRFGFAAAYLAGASFVALAFVLVQVWVREVPGRAGEPFRPFDREIFSPGIVGVGVATFVMASAFSMMTTLEEQFNARLHETALGFSVAFSALMVSRLIFQIPLGRLSDRIGRRPPVLAGLLLMAPVTALLGLSSTTVDLTLLRLVQGLAAAAIAAPAFALAADLSRAGGEGRQMGIITMSFGLGIAIGPLIAGVLAVYSFELPFVIGGLMCLAGAAVVLRYVPETVPRRDR
jgi:MFS family permease